MSSASDFAPGVAEQLEAMTKEGVEPTAVSVDAPAAPRFVGRAILSAPFDLDFPVEYDGKTYDQVLLRRMTFAQMRDFVELLAEMSPEQRKDVNFPVFADADGSLIPDVVLNALEADDRVRLDEAADGFLPRRFRVEPESASPPSPGATTEPS